ncbi:MAG: hypothetical protein FRX49_01998 [Trebouxia sp. A1-2]|nr:MAG: hypothetical protein FRX49_01998 [Trebouxia sp. A1-2]
MSYAETEPRGCQTHELVAVPEAGRLQSPGQVCGHNGRSTPQLVHKPDVNLLQEVLQGMMQGSVLDQYLECDRQSSRVQGGARGVQRGASKGQPRSCHRMYLILHDMSVTCKQHAYLEYQLEPRFEKQNVAASLQMLLPRGSWRAGDHP